LPSSERTEIAISIAIAAAEEAFEQAERDAMPPTKLDNVRKTASSTRNYASRDRSAACWTRPRRNLAPAMTDEVSNRRHSAPWAPVHGIRFVERLEKRQYKVRLRARSLGHWVCPLNHFTPAKA